MTLSVLRRGPVPRTPAAAGSKLLAWPLLGTLALLLAATLLAAQFGPVAISMADWLAPWRAAHDDGSAAFSGAAHVLWQIRLPRVIFALLVGAALALAGSLTQALFRNPLADPGLLGVTTGAACAAALTLVIFASAAAPLPPAWRPWVLPVAAFCGALLVCFSLDRIARWLTPGSIAGLLLTGLAINAVTAAVIGLATYLATDEQLRSLSFWTLGSLAGAGWSLVATMAVLLALLVPFACRLARPLNALALGEAAASHVGIAVPRLRGWVVLLVALSCGAAVAWCGVIGFLGLLAPHLARACVGADLRRQLPFSMLLGGALLLLADTLARTLAAPAEIPVGIFTALIGGPAFLLMLRAAVRQQGGSV